MCLVRTFSWVLVVATVWLAGECVSAQQVTVATPFQSNNQSFFEHMGLNWSLQGRGWNASFGAPNIAAPQFGGFNPSAGTTLGFGIMFPGVSGQFNANYSQGFRQNLISQTPSVTVQNGMPGYVSDSSLSPFVISYIPVVGGYPVIGGFPPVMGLWPGMMPLYSMSPQFPAPAGAGSAVQEALRRARAGTTGAIAARPPDAVADDVAVRPAHPAAERAPAQAKQEDLKLLGGSETRKAADRSAEKFAQLQGSSAERPAPSVAEARRLRAAEQANANDEAVHLSLIHI